MRLISSTRYIALGQLVSGALFDDPAQQFAQGLLLPGAEYTEHLLVSGHGVTEHLGHHISPLIGQVGLQDALVLGVLLSFHQAAPFECRESQLHPLRADQQAPGEGIANVADLLVTWVTGVELSPQAASSTAPRITSAVGVLIRRRELAMVKRRASRASVPPTEQAPGRTPARSAAGGAAPGLLGASSWSVR